MKIAVIILNWNGKHLLEKFLPSVVAYSQEVDIYVIDNASSDDSISYLTSHFPEVQLIRNPLNGGYAQGYNWGLAKISADLYCLLNSDIEVTENWLLPVINVFKNSEIGAVQPKILDYKNKKTFEYAGAAGGFIDKYGFPFCRGRIFETIEEDYGQYNSQTDIFWASGACLFVRSEVFNQLKGFDEDFFAHQEEIDLCWRIHHLNKRVVFCPESIVYHVGGATLPVDSPKKTFLNFRNGLFMLLKNLPQENLYKTLFIRLIFDGIAGIRFLLQGKIRFTWAIFKAHMNFYRNFFKFKNKRPKHTFSSYYNTKSIVWLYFVKNKKFFSDFH